MTARDPELEGEHAETAELREKKARVSFVVP